MAPQGSLALVTRTGPPSSASGRAAAEGASLGERVPRGQVECAATCQAACLSRVRTSTWAGYAVREAPVTLQAMAIEIANLVEAMVSFIASDPPVIVSQSGIRSLERTAPGIFLMELEGPALPVGPSVPLSPGAQIHCQTGAPNFAVGAQAPDGRVGVQTYNIGGSVTDTAVRVDVLVLRYPTTS